MEPQAIIAQQYPKVVIPLIQNVKQSIKIIIFDWRWYPMRLGSTVSTFNQAIIEAQKRGVDVMALVSSEQVLTRLKSHGIQAKMVYSKKMLHTKLMLLDDKIVVLGSHNYTQNAFALNHECSVAFSLETSDNEFVKYFSSLWGV